MTNIRQVMIMIMMILTVLITSSYSRPVHAASEDDCSIWLCLPTGFPSGCGKAKSAFKKRIKKFKPPLPSFISCMIKQNEIPPQLVDSYRPSNMTYKEGVAAKMGGGTFIDGRRCIYRRQDHEIVDWEPLGCIGTYHFIQTFMDNKPYGEKYYYDY